MQGQTDKKTMYFFCDIQGTFSNISHSEDKVAELVNNIIKLKEKTISDTVYFSFNTTAGLEELKQNVDTISPYLDGTQIELGTQFCEAGTINLKNREVIASSMKSLRSKADIILNYLLPKNMKEISKIFVADDSVVNNIILENMWRSHIDDREKLILLNPSPENDLNSCIKKELIKLRLKPESLMLEDGR